MQLSWVAASGNEIDPELWPGCKTVGCVVSQRVVGDKVAELEEHCYISSRTGPSRTGFIGSSTSASARTPA